MYLEILPLDESMRISLESGENSAPLTLPTDPNRLYHIYEYIFSSCLEAVARYIRWNTYSDISNVEAMQRMTRLCREMARKVIGL